MSSGFVKIEGGFGKKNLSILSTLITWQKSKNDWWQWHGYDQNLRMSFS